MGKKKLLYRLSIKATQLNVWYYDKRYQLCHLLIYVIEKETNSAVKCMLAVMEVSRPDFIGLGLVSVSSVKGLGLEVRRSQSHSRLLYRDHKTWKKKKMKKRGIKKALSRR